MSSRKKPAKPRRSGEAVRSMMDLVPPSAGAGSEALKPLMKAKEGVRGRPWTNLKALAKENSLEAMEKLIELIGCDNDCVALGASKLVIERGLGRVPIAHQRSKSGGVSSGKRGSAQVLKIQIRRFKEEETGGDTT